MAGVDHRHGMGSRAIGAALWRGGCAVGRAVCRRARGVGRAVVRGVDWRGPTALPSWAFFSLPTRAWELAVGGLVALTAGAWRHLPGPSAALVGWGGLALIVVTCTQIGEETPYPGTTALLPVLGTALIIGAGCATPDLGVGRLPVEACDAIDRPAVLLVVPVALAGAAARAGGGRSAAGPDGQVGDGGGVVRAGDPDAAPGREPVAVRAVADGLGAAKPGGGWGADGCCGRGVLGPVDGATGSGGSGCGGGAGGTCWDCRSVGGEGSPADVGAGSGVGGGREVG